MTSEYLENRYGKTKAKARNQRIFWVSVGAILVVAFFAWSIAINFLTPANISANVKNFTVSSPEQTQVTVSIENPTGRDGTCAIKVLNEQFTVIGYKELAIAASLGRSATLEISVNTLNLGVSASVDRCWLK
jgi:hypothetical protein